MAALRRKIKLPWMNNTDNKYKIESNINSKEKKGNHCHPHFPTRSHIQESNLSACVLWVRQSDEAAGGEDTIEWRVVLAQHSGGGPPRVKWSSGNPDEGQGSWQRNHTFSQHKYGSCISLWWRRAKSLTGGRRAVIPLIMVKKTTSHLPRVIHHWNIRDRRHGGKKARSTQEAVCPSVFYTCLCSI